MTQSQLAEIAMVSVKTINRWESSYRSSTPQQTQIRSLVDALHLNEAERTEFITAANRSSMRANADLASATSHNFPFDALPTAASLPQVHTPFIGRKEELDAIVKRLHSVHLLTLTGPGGIGKTRLALAAAESVLNRYPGGVFFVDLTSVGDSSSVAAAMTQALGLPKDTTLSAHEELVMFLRPRRVLLLLDNAEHLMDVAPLLAGLLGACPQLTILVTSRVSLRLRGEHLFTVPPLSTTESVTLFVEHARAVQPRFAPNSTSRPAVIAICQLLGGLPLAIELAAARTRVLSPSELLTRLEHPLALSMTGPRDAPARQRTLRASLAWSYDLLGRDAQALFRRLAIFPDGFTLEAAEIVCRMDAGGETTVDTGVLDGITTLVDVSLLRAEEQQLGQTRFRLLRIVRDYGLEQLAASGEMGDVQRAYVLYFLSLAEKEEASIGSRGSVQAMWLDGIIQEHHNLQQALEWAQEDWAGDIGPCLTRALGRVAMSFDSWGTMAQERGDLAWARKLYLAAVAFLTLALLGRRYAAH